MTGDDGPDAQLIRTIFREEIQRDRTGPRCPECGSQEMNWTMLDIDRMVAAEETWTVLCGGRSCSYGGPPETFDPMKQSLGAKNGEI